MKVEEVSPTYSLYSAARFVMAPLPLFLLLSVALVSTALPLSSTAFTRGPSSPTTVKCRTRYGHHFLSSKGHDGGDDADLSNDSRAFLPAVQSRRQFFLRQIIASAFFPTSTQAATDLSSTMDNEYFSLRNNNNIPYAQRKQILSQQKREQRERTDKRKRATSSSRMKKWTQFANVKRWNNVETCLLEMLPVTNGVFRQLQDLIEDLVIYPAGDSVGWKQTLLDAATILSVLDSKRSSLEPVFNQEDPTELYIAKSSIGESNIEVLRSKLEDLIAIASGDIHLNMNGGGRTSVNRVDTRNNIDIDNINMDEAGDIDTDAFAEGKRQALFALSELGELLVPAFPFAVPSRGKFGYLPRLLGRCSVTFSFERPSSAASTFGVNFVGNDKRFLGNVTIIADGYAAPITAGNFVDLSARNFYTGLSVKAMRKRLGVVPTWSDNVIVNDLTELKDNLDELKDSAFDFPETLKKDANAGNDRGGSMKSMFKSNQDDDSLLEPVYDGSRMTMDVVLPILGSFQEGFYDPLTAKPRRIPLEVVTLDGTSPTKTTLTYSSTYASLDDMTDSGTTKYSGLASSSSAQRSFSSATSLLSSNSTRASFSNLEPVLSFNIPDLVALNHPDRLSNGGSSEFFALPGQDASSKRSKLLDGQYAPFGYVVSGSDVYQSLRPGDVIRATYVSEVGLLNLVKIRKNAFEGGEDIADEEGTDDES